MKSLLRLPRQGEGGFTLLEILIVVVILGTLAAIVIPNIIFLTSEGLEEAKQTEYYNVRLAVLAMMVKAERSQLDDGAYPMTVQEKAECNNVQVTDNTVSPNITYYLDNQLISGQFPLLQAYEITQDGDVTLAD
jgi:prepilin-type N-terminal cleavage/methylation domain-containing protein